MRKILSLTRKNMRRYGGWAVRYLLGRTTKTARATVTDVALVDGQLVFTGRIVSSFDINSCVLTLRKFRQEEITHNCQMHVRKSAEMTFSEHILGLLGLRWHRFCVKLDINWSQLPASIYGVSYICDGQVRHLKIADSAAQILTDATTQRTYCVFSDPAAHLLRIEMYHFGPDIVAALRVQGASPRPSALRCIVGEYTNTARDNGRILFDWLRTQAPDIDAAYVIEADNVDHFSVNQPGVLTFGSHAHLSFCMDVQVCAFTHHRSYVYPYILRLIAPTRYQTAQSLFLQHGIIAMKKSIVSHYHYQQIRYDAFCVSSQGEKDIITRHFGYPAERVHITGLPRFDRLLGKTATAVASTDHVMVFPTWRAGFDKKTSAEIAQTPFILNWQQALKALRAAGIKTHLMMHPVLGHHEALLAPYADQTSRARDFQDVLMQSAALITDYSSVSFDALFVKKPVFLFQFSDGTGAASQDAFVDIATQSPGQISTSSTDLVGQVLQAQTDQWAFTQHAQHKQYFASNDTQNAVRVGQVLRSLAANIR